ncbi:MAG: DUF1987 domain-containing protein [Bacteroidota bacterium]|nr:DUF1987 domain-containing protein [Bacteroidota bacterium]
MQKKFTLKPTDDLPGVVLDKKEDIFIIYGRVLPEDGNKFFQPILNWVEDYVKNPNKNTEFIFRLDYYNSSTARMLTRLIVELEKLQENNSGIKVIWEYFEEDEIMLERGEELKSISYLPFEMRPLSEKITI